MYDFKDFDEALKQLGPAIPEPTRKQWIWVNDTLSLAQVIARSAFGEGVSPEVVLQVYDRLAARILKPYDPLAEPPADE